MTDPLRIGGLLLYSADETPGTSVRSWRCLPAQPSLVTGPAGAPMLLVMDVAGAATISLTARLHVPDSALAEAATQLAHEVGIPVALVEVRPVTVREAVARLLLVGDESVELARSTTSGTWPYHAALHAPLSPQQVAAVRGGLAGQRGTLLLRYEVRFSVSDGPAPSHHSEIATTSTMTSTTTTTKKGEATVTESHTDDHRRGRAAASFSALRIHDITLHSDAADWLIGAPATP